MFVYADASSKFKIARVDASVELKMAVMCTLLVVVLGYTIQDCGNSIIYIYIFIYIYIYGGYVMCG